MTSRKITVQLFQAFTARKEKLTTSMNNEFADKNYWQSLIDETEVTEKFISWVWLQPEFESLVEKYKEKMVEDYRRSLEQLIKD